MPTYIEREYPLDETGENDFPQKLVNHIRQEYFTRSHGYLLDIGCGNGTYVYCFHRSGLDAVGVDKESGHCIDLEVEELPWNNDTFDYIFSKSSLEHIYNTNHVLEETKRVLSPKGLVLFIVPDYHAQWKNFYDDVTHVKPFTKKSLKQAFELAGFKVLKCESIINIPFAWRHKNITNMLCLFIRLIPDRFKYSEKGQRVWIRHGKERMLLLLAQK